jgi:hypothetical protein
VNCRNPDCGYEDENDEERQNLQVARGAGFAWTVRAKEHVTADVNLRVSLTGCGGTLCAVTKKFEADLTGAVWRRSAASDDAAVEVALLENGVAVRDSRHPDGDVLFFTPAEWDAFVGGAKDGEFDV